MKEEEDSLEPKIALMNQYKDLRDTLKKSKENSHLQKWQHKTKQEDNKNQKTEIG